MSLKHTLVNAVKDAMKALYDVELPSVEIQATRKEFEGELTVMVFPMLRMVKGDPVAIGEALGSRLKANVTEVSDFNVVKGFLNLVISDTYYLNFFNEIRQRDRFGHVLGDDAPIMVEYASPNTNKPLHLGHVRNVLLGYSVAEILKAAGHKVYKTQIINDRGIHICKSMLAYKRFGRGKKPTPELKGDKLVGDCYVRFDEEFKNQLQTVIKNARAYVSEAIDQQFLDNRFHLNEVLSSGTESKPYFDMLKKSLIDFINYKKSDLNIVYKDDSNYELLFSKNLDHLFSGGTLESVEKLRNVFIVNFGYWLELPKSPYIDDKDVEEYLSENNLKKVKSFVEANSTELVGILDDAYKMLRDWEKGDKKTIQLWQKLNSWVYEGFDATYKAIGVDFDKNYYESDTYLLGKEFIAEGLEKGVFFKKEDGSVWCDLTDEGLDEKIVLRSDGTAVYMTQDIGTAIQRVKDHPDVSGMVYTVGNEQDYHFKVLFLILQKLGFDWAKNLFHLSYGMVDLPSGKMKSREGTVVDADDLIEEMRQTAEDISKELGKLDGYSEEEKQAIYRKVGLGALKYFILKVDPKKRILFDPKESVDFQGNTGPFIQYTYARIQAIVRKATFGYSEVITPSTVEGLHAKEKELIRQLQQFPEVIQQSAKQHSPALIANYAYDLVKVFNSFYQTVTILGEEDEKKKILRVQLSKKVGDVIADAFALLGVEVPERM